MSIPYKWSSKLDNPHVSVTLLAPYAEDSAYIISPAPVDQKNSRGKPQYKGHVNTLTPLLCYRTSKTRAWVTIGFAVQAEDLTEDTRRMLRPADDYYFHISLAKLEVPKTKK